MKTLYLLTSVRVPNDTPDSELIRIFDIATQPEKLAAIGSESIKAPIACTGFELRYRERKRTDYGMMSREDLQGHLQMYQEELMELRFAEGEPDLQAIHELEACCREIHGVLRNYNWQDVKTGRRGQIGLPEGFLVQAWNAGV